MRNCAIVVAAGIAALVVGVWTPSASAALLASYKFNNTSATNVPDDSGNGHTGTFFGTAGYNTSNTAPGVGGAGSLSVGSGVSGLSLIVNAVNSFNQMSTNNAGTIVFWENVAAANQSQFNFRTGAGDRQFMAHAPWGDGNIYFDTGGCCDPDTRLSGSAGDVTGWHHWAFVKNGNDKFVYKDGALLLSQSGTATTPIGTVNFTTLGNYSETETHGINGLMDEVAIYSHALTQGEIQVLMTQGVPVPEPTSAALLSLAGIALLRRRR